MYLFFLPFLAAGLGLPLLGGQAVATQKYKSIQKVAEAAYSQLDITLLIVRFFLIFVLVLLTFWLILKLRSFWGEWRVKRLAELLYRLKSETAMRKKVKALSDEEKQYLLASTQETVEMLMVRLKRRNYFAKRLGQKHCNMMVDTLLLMKEGKVDLSEQSELIAHWLEILNAFTGSN